MKFRAQVKHNTQREYIAVFMKPDETIEQKIITCFNRHEAEKTADGYAYRLGYRLLRIRKR